MSIQRQLNASYPKSWPNEFQEDTITVEAYTCVSLLIILIPVLFILQFSGCLRPFSAYFPVNVHVLPHPTSMVSVSGQ